MRGIDVEWTWDAEQGRFLRSQQGGRHIDQLHGRIGAENVLVFGTWYRPSAIDARSPEAQTITQGAPLWVFSDGELSEDSGFARIRCSRSSSSTKPASRSS